MVALRHEDLHVLCLSLLEVLHLDLSLRNRVRSQLPNVELERRVVVRLAVVVLVAVQDVADPEPLVQLLLVVLVNEADVQLPRQLGVVCVRQQESLDVELSVQVLRVLLKVEHRRTE